MHRACTPAAAAVEPQPVSEAPNPAAAMVDAGPVDASVETPLDVPVDTPMDSLDGVNFDALLDSDEDLLGEDPNPFASDPLEDPGEPAKPGEPTIGEVAVRTSKNPD